MGKRSLEPEKRKLNLVKVFIAIAILALLIYLSIKGILNLIGNEDKNQNEIAKENTNESSQTDIENVETKTIEQIVSEFGGEIKEKVKEDTYYILKDGTDYTAYLDGEIVPGKIVPWNGEETKPEISEDEKINISTAGELAWVANQVINGEKNFSGVTITLKNNIDLGGREKEDGTWEGPEWKTIIGFLDELPEKQDANKTTNKDTIVTDETTEIINENLKRFDGNFDGNNFSIRGIKINSNKRYQGLFGYLSGTVSNLKIKASNINGEDAVGAIAGLCSGKINNCIVENTKITGKNKIGGLVGIAMTEATIENSFVYEPCKVTGEKNVGGLIGYTNNNVTIRNSSNGAIIKGNDYIGGITGIAFYGTIIENSSNFSKEIEGENYVGGIAGYSAAQIEKCYNQNLTENSALLKGKNYIGGIVGANYEMGDISSCFNNCEITTIGDNCGGIVGINSSSISNCYNKGSVDCKQATGLRIGGICGQNLSESFINNSYNIGKIKNVNYAGGVVGADFGKITNAFCIENCLEEQTSDTEYKKSEEDMKNNIIQELGNSFKQDNENKNTGYPILNWQ